jgi:hypothetical protein
MSAARKAEVVHMADGREYMTTDGWETAVVISRSGKVTKLKGEALDLARFLAASQAHASPNWKKP